MIEAFLFKTDDTVKQNGFSRVRSCGNDVRLFGD
jgi:hypothetical protein